MHSILVTGGCGFIGSNFIRCLLTEAGFAGRVVNVDKLTYAGNPDNLTDIAEKFPDRYVFIRADICDRSAMTDVFGRFAVDAVCHFAAESHVDRSIAAPEAFVKTNVDGTFTLLEAARERGSFEVLSASGLRAPHLHADTLRREMVLLDFSEAIFVARENLRGASNALFFLGDLRRMPFRDDFADLVYAGQTGKWNAVIDEIVEEHDRGRPVMVGTISVEISEMLSEMLKRRGVKHNVLNAKFHEREAEIISQAGRSDAVTIATNMAGRGTDILLGGNPDTLAAELLHQQGTTILEATPEQIAAAQAEAETICAADREKVVALGGLHIVGTERHEARRIDNQLRGRSGRQGDPGSSRFYLSLEDDLMRRFASDRVQGIMKTVGFTDDMALESGIVSRTIEGAQTRVEGYNFDLRKHVVQYDDVINLQRETIYSERDHILRATDLTDTILGLVDADIRSVVGEFTADDTSEWNREGLKAHLQGMIPTLTAGELAVVDESRNVEALTDQLIELAGEHYRRKREELGEQAGYPAAEGFRRVTLAQ